MNERFTQKLNDPHIVKDTTTIGDFIQIFCEGNHAGAARRSVETDGALLGIYGSKRPSLCEECEAHLAYAEKRRAYCNQDPKPFCAYCEAHCYRSDEREWQRQMMRYSGPRSWRKGYAIEGIKHAIDGRKYRRLAEAKARATTAGTDTAAPAAEAQEES